MKRLLLVLLIASLFFPSCRPLMEWIGEEMDSHHYAKWYAKNTASAPISITTALITDSIVYPGDSIRIKFRSPLQEYGVPLFSLLYDSPNTIDPYVVKWIDITSSEGGVLRTWKYTERDSSGRQFFSEAYWRRYEERSDYSPTVKLTWVFDILPEDIAPAKPEP